MCLILLGYRAHARYPLVVAANRDEFYSRPTAAASFWREAPELLAGRDLVHGGTWLGITREGRIGAVTNYRDPSSFSPAAPSRGELVGDFLLSSSSPSAYLEKLGREAGRYNPFSLIFGDPTELYCYSTRGDSASRITPGVHGLSNHLLDTPWPKVTRGREGLTHLLAAADIDPEELFTLLADTAPAPDELLPSTGVGQALERALSASFIRTHDYGTRSSTVILMGEGGEVLFEERSFDQGAEPRTVRHRFKIG